MLSHGGGYRLDAELARILAVGGAPMRAQELSGIARTTDDTDVLALLREAVDEEPSITRATARTGSTTR